MTYHSYFLRSTKPKPWVKRSYPCKLRYPFRHLQTIFKSDYFLRSKKPRNNYTAVLIDKLHAKEVRHFDGLEFLKKKKRNPCYPDKYPYPEWEGLPYNQHNKYETQDFSAWFAIHKCSRRKCDGTWLASSWCRRLAKGCSWRCIDNGDHDPRFCNNYYHVTHERVHLYTRPKYRDCSNEKLDLIYAWNRSLWFNFLKNKIKYVKT